MNKYNAKKIHAAGGVFDSKKEFNRYIDLQGMELAGEISDLKRQVRFELIPKQMINGKVAERACYYVADFTYIRGGEYIVEDVKSAITRKKPEYIIKRKLMLWRHGYRIQEV